MFRKIHQRSLRNVKTISQLKSMSQKHQINKKTVYITSPEKSSRKSQLGKQ